MNQSDCFALDDPLRPDETRCLNDQGCDDMTIHYQPTYPAADLGDITPVKLRYQSRRSIYRNVTKRVSDLIAVAILALPTLAIMLMVLPLIVSSPQFQYH